MSKYFIVCWCNEGLETIIPATDIDQLTVFNLLANKSAPRSIQQSLNMIVMRAKFNSQRAYEIYSIEAVDGIEEADIRAMFDNSPQDSAETMRRIGNKIYSDRVESGRVKIT